MPFAFFPSRRVALEVFGLDIHWYGLMYLGAFLLAYALLPRLQRYRNMRLSNDAIASVLAWTVAGVIVGGRLGFVFFYQPSMLTEDPLGVFAVWRGGMASHGGFLGVALALLWILRRLRVPVLAFADVAVVPIALGLALGRVGNFINAELYGPVTQLPWGVSFPGVEGARHPTQIYAVLQNLFIAGACYLHLRHIRTAGRTTVLFLILYGVLRFAMEYLRVQHYPGYDVGIMVLTRGQVLTVPILLAGIVLWLVVRRTLAGSGTSN